MEVGLRACLLLWHALVAQTDTYKENVRMSRPIRRTPRPLNVKAARAAAGSAKPVKPTKPVKQTATARVRPAPSPISTDTIYDDIEDGETLDTFPDEESEDDAEESDSYTDDESDDDGDEDEGEDDPDFYDDSDYDDSDADGDTDDEDEDDSTSPSSATHIHTASSYKRGKVLQLPTGGAFLIRPVSFSTLILRGEQGAKDGIPNTLLPAARRMMGGRGINPNDPRQRDEAAKLADVLVCRLVAQPHIVMKRPEACRGDELSIQEVHEADKTAIINFSVRGQRALEPFRPKRRVR